MICKSKLFSIFTHLTLFSRFKEYKLDKKQEDQKFELILISRGFHFFNVVNVTSDVSNRFCIHNIILYTQLITIDKWLFLIIG